MAFSTFSLTPKDVSICQFCEESFYIKWKCINCDLLLCQLCHSRIHSKSKSSTDHKVINLKDYDYEDAIETTREVDLTRMNCEQHSDEKCLLHCKTCDKPVCSDCLVGDHHNHKYSKLDIVYKRKLKVIRDIKDKIELNIPFFKTQGANLQHVLSEEKNQFKENKDKIIEFRDKIIRHADKLLSTLDKLRKPREDLIKKELDSVRQRKDGLEKWKTQLDLTLGSSFANDIFVTSSSIDKTMPDVIVTCLEVKQTKFIPGKLFNQPIDDLFGSVYEVPNIKVTKTYKSELKCTKCVKYKCGFHWKS